MRSRIVGFLGSALVVFAACEGGDARFVDEGSSGLQKGLGGTNGDFDFCDNPLEPCAAGEGDCDSSAQCLPGLVCQVNVGTQYGFSASTDVCVGSTCTNRIWDTNECGVDCGGTSGCGTCTNIPSKTCGGINGTAGYCSNPNQPCLSGEGNCSSNSQCAAGLSCVGGAGPRFGFASNIAVCLAATCSNRIWDTNECGVDCGGTSGCGTCTNPPSKTCGGANGTAGFCSNPNQLCAAGEGNCSNDGQCQAGLRCTTGAGVKFGFPSNIAVCVAPTCSNGVRDPGEDGVDCGGGCGACPPTGSYLFDRTFGGASEDLLRGVAIDSSGNVYAIGYFIGTVDLGGGPLVSAGGRDVVIASWTSDGTLRWANRYGGTTDQIGLGIAVDSAGAVLVTGYFQSTIDFGTGVLTAPGTGQQAIFLAKLSSSGSAIWANSYGDPVNNQQGWALATDGTDIVLTGQYRSTVDLGGGNLPTATDWRIFVARFDGSGAHQWSEGYGEGAVRAHCRSVAIDSSGNIVLGGQFRNGSLDFGGGAMSNPDPLLYDGFVVRLAGSGTVSWQRQFGDGSDQHVRFVGVDPAGRIAVGGYAQGTIDLGCGTLTSGGGWDAFWGQLAPDGSCNWSNILGGAGDQFIDAMVVDNFGNIYVGGDFERSLGFTCQPIRSDGARDGWFASFGPSGSCRWARRFGGPGAQRVYAIASGSNRTYVVGGFEQGANFGGGVRTSAGGFDAFLARYTN